MRVTLLGTLPCSSRRRDGTCSSIRSSRTRSPRARPCRVRRGASTSGAAEDRSPRALGRCADRLDVAALARIPRDCPVVAPKDPTATYVLERLGFRKVRPDGRRRAAPFPEGFELLTTPSTRKVTEYGIFLKDASGTFWDPVACMLSRPIVEQVRAAMGPTDLFLAPYAFQDFAFVGSQRAGFPGSSSAAASRARRTWRRRSSSPAPRACASTVRSSGPTRSSSPSRASDSSRSWRARRRRAGLDRKPRRRVRDRSAPVERRPNASPLVEMIADDTDRLEFDPTREVPPLTDPNLDGYSHEVLESQVTACFEELAAFVRGAWPDRRSARRRAAPDARSVRARRRVPGLDGSDGSASPSARRVRRSRRAPGSCRAPTTRTGWRRPSSRRVPATSGATISRAGSCA
jgi:hypothetical protein